MTVPLAAVPHHRPQRLAYLGTPELAVAPLRALVAAGFEVSLVVTRRDTRRGRGSATSPSPVKAAAIELGLAVSHTVDDVIAIEVRGTPVLIRDPGGVRGWRDRAESHRRGRGCR